MLIGLAIAVVEEGVSGFVYQITNDEVKSKPAACENFERIVGLFLGFCLTVDYFIPLSFEMRVFINKE